MDALPYFNPQSNLFDILAACGATCGTCSDKTARVIVEAWQRMETDALAAGTVTTFYDQ